MNDFALVCIALFFALTPVLLSLLVRESVKKSRQRIIADLALFFKVDALTTEKPADREGDDLLHSFEFVKFKYGSDRGRPGKSEGRDGPNDFTADEWTLAALPLLILLTLANIVVVVILVVSFKLSCADLSVPVCVVAFFKTHEAYRLALLSAYLGAYVYMIRAFFQAINNFDLMPASFFGAFNNLIFGLALPQVVFFYFTTAASPAANVDHKALAISALIITFFVGGYMPDAVLRWVLQRSAIRVFKEERFDFGARGKSTPVEVLDGIDSLIRFRLTDFHITTVQNLACANPIMLFVETPFGIYQMIDWVAQAQLCASVGVDRLFNLWDLGIRTIFDLERVALHKEFQDDNLLWAIENALFGVKAKGRLGVPEPLHLLHGKPADWDHNPIIKNITSRIDNAYTHRLRQIVICVADQLGGETTRFLPSIVLPETRANP